MKNQQDSQSTGELKPLLHEPLGGKQKKLQLDGPVADSGSISISSSDDIKVSREDIELVQNLIERCLQLYMNRAEVVKTLCNRARIESGFTTLVWQKLEEENPDFFRAYYIRLKLKKQIILFNHFLEHQYQLMKKPMTPKIPMMPMQNGIHPVPVNNLPIGYPVLQQSPMPAPGQPHLDNTNRGLSSCHVVNGVPVPGNYHHPIRVNIGNDNMMDGSGGEVAPPLGPCSTMSSLSELAISPASASASASASSGHFPFAPSEISGMEIDNSMLDTDFASDMGNSGDLQLRLDENESSKDSLRSLGQIPWTFSLSDLAANLSDLDELGALGNYTGSPFLPSESDILLDFPEHDDSVEEYFVDNITGPVSDEEKP
ncbi:hypothetical protein ZOSMA_2G03150 [Zostera marina]|uniref:Uncharacterized protein n=1 Tax=Zostera marina TaxID=29655 RepID=A0A0K9PDK4_ZOSMR|nr:hypothetical protein ZOSMA_2G03150 [Zostera marina]